MPVKRAVALIILAGMLSWVATPVFAAPLTFTLHVRHSGPDVVGESLAKGILKGLRQSENLTFLEQFSPDTDFEVELHTLPVEEGVRTIYALLITGANPPPLRSMVGRRNGYCDAVDVDDCIHGLLFHIDVLATRAQQDPSAFGLNRSGRQ